MATPSRSLDHQPWAVARASRLAARRGPPAARHLTTLRRPVASRPAPNYNSSCGFCPAACRQPSRFSTSAVVFHGLSQSSGMCRRSGSQEGVRADRRADRSQPGNGRNPAASVPRRRPGAAVHLPHDPEYRVPRPLPHAGKPLRHDGPHESSCSFCPAACPAALSFLNFCRCFPWDIAISWNVSAIWKPRGNSCGSTRRSIRTWKWPRSSGGCSAPAARPCCSPAPRPGYRVPRPLPHAGKPLRHDGPDAIPVPRHAGRRQAVGETPGRPGRSLAAADDLPQRPLDGLAHLAQAREARSRAGVPDDHRSASATQIAGPTTAAPTSPCRRSIRKIPANPGLLRSNLGMYRVQLSGNRYERESRSGACITRSIAASAGTMPRPWS